MIHAQHMPWRKIVIAVTVIGFILTTKPSFALAPPSGFDELNVAGEDDRLEAEFEEEVTGASLRWTGNIVKDTAWVLFASGLGAADVVRRGEEYQRGKIGALADVRLERVIQANLRAARFNIPRGNAKTRVRTMHAAGNFLVAVAKAMARKARGSYLGRDGRLPRARISGRTFTVEASIKKDGKPKKGLVKHIILRDVGQAEPALMVSTGFREGEENILCYVVAGSDLMGWKCRPYSMALFFEAFPGVRRVDTEVPDPIAFALLESEFGFGPKRNVRPNAYLGEAIGLEEKAEPCFPIYFSTKAAREKFENEALEWYANYIIVKRKPRNALPIHIGVPLIMRDKAKFKAALARYSVTPVEEIIGESLGKGRFLEARDVSRSL